MDPKKFLLSYYRNATKNFHIMRVTAPQEALQLHSHNYYQVYYVLRGSIRHHISTGSASLSAGDIFILPPNMPHYIEVLKREELAVYAMSFTPDFFQPSKESNPLLRDYLYYLRTAPVQRIPPRMELSYEDSSFAAVLFHRIFEEFLSNKAGKNEIIKESVAVLLSVFARACFEGSADALYVEENRQMVLYCIDYIKSHFDEPISLTEMVRLSAMSKTCFCSIFTSITGATFKEYLNRYRVERAAELLLAGEKVSVAGSSCGFSDFSTFYRNFKKHYGISPSDFIQKNR